VVPQVAPVFTRVALALPRLALFFPHVDFLAFSGLSLSISLFLKKKRREKEPREEKQHPRVLAGAYFLIHGFPRQSTPIPWISVDTFIHKDHGDKCYG
jgi:hypothetical protein